jgi:hypothetical protein
MSVYVDRIRDHGASVKGSAKRWGSLWSHLFADSDEELDTFAIDKLGLKRIWGQHRGVPGRFHYDVLPKVRAKAIKAGAIEVDNHTMIAILKGQRERGRVA